MPNFEAWWWQERPPDPGPPKFKVGDWVYWLESPFYSVGEDPWSDRWKFRIDDVAWDSANQQWVYVCGRENILGQWYAVSLHANLYHEADPMLEQIRRSMKYTDGLGNEFPSLPSDFPLAFRAGEN